VVFVFGGLLVGAGLFVAWGGLTGRLAVMLGAVFQPAALTASAGSPAAATATATPNDGRVTPPGTPVAVKAAPGGTSRFGV
jgi:hypothetical protein